MSRLHLALDDAAIEAVLNAHSIHTYDTSEAAWIAEETKAIGRRRISWRQKIARRLFGTSGARKQSNVRDAYETEWSKETSVGDHVTVLENKTVPAKWRHMGMHLSPQALRKVHLMVFSSVIETLKPRSVLEVGCGNGHMTIELAKRFPDVSFFGCDLTDAGVKVANSAGSTAQFKQADARDLPYPDNAVDLVITRIALEQMEAIRDKALSEIARVANIGAAMIEPWRDFNASGPGRDYIERQGYFCAWARDVEKLGMKVAYMSGDLPHKVPQNNGIVLALKRSADA
jgi:SAM-dependent methyltransferase